MERESFENAEVAKLLNDWFVAVKVDREERPDIDAVYMAAVNALGESGGWPLSMFLTPDGKPVVGGTYWPPEDREHGGKRYRGFKSILKFMHDWQSTKPLEVRGQADRLAELTGRVLAARGQAAVELDRTLVRGALAGVRDEFDSEYGGFGARERGFRGSKFPLPSYLSLLLDEAERGRSTEALDMVRLTLERMARGGIYDQLGGGFHRYSTDRTWTVPHFEKMLYDNAQLVEVYARAYRLTGSPLLRRVVEETLAFVRRDMTSPDGGFYSALDAETGAQEGRYYVWAEKEIDGALGNVADAGLVKRVYGAEGGANFESGYHVLLLPRPIADVARDLGMIPEQLEARLVPLRQKLYEARCARARPFLDTKILTAWNGQMIAGFAVAGHILREQAHVETAARAARFVLEHLRNAEGRLLRSYAAAPGRGGEAKLNAYLDDYAYLIHGLLCLHDATADRQWLDEARALVDMMLRLHEDPVAGGFFFTSNDHEKLFARAKDQHDGAEPAGNSVAALDLVRLWSKTKDARYREAAKKTLKAFAGTLQSSPSSLTAMAGALERYLEVEERGGQERQGTAEEPVQTGGARRSDGVVKVRASADKVDGEGRQVLSVVLTIDPGWHVYANPVGKDFPGIPTTLSVAGLKAEDVKITYPLGQLVQDAVAGDYYIYEGNATIKAAVRRAKGDTTPLEVSLKIQACNKEKCLLPATVKLSVP
jgi:uncharacterized protein YyaL (SSP411 family)